ncbi:PAS and ANTAR domain-containing protein [Mycobacteroides abscessus subsp. abscessus]|uniref:PAS and ANTAR domain-containing protein n=1 Tax=Mycobacteroides abscessus TaxID=36809 RepID=UPI0002F9D0C6|nr:PAS and ANTAR domain-containing protein [Mycobacteroides abscessus]MDO3101109.1 PAS and ANTAR domain-containing protein [Mycobacteroides abscessus subsp. abscessus]MDO3185072.1 PAS and ANTAR domain-containing protein [Mycobacteroides abscessus subsp. abscessus]MDO3194304.1 PAS and ANTAR domain-containing protein [Mycobacteroides abscessus subsp. abscessus]MDO3287501.1 PAS and ANTAR domain-containing protein [Mycobacteroides abscessus subsp. abscessus]OLT84784.1 antitermination regulator [My
MGWFRFYFDEQRWEWSPQVARLHGYEPGAVSPTTELVLAHKHPEDRGKVASTIDAITHTRGALSSRHRIIDTSGAVHWVVVIGDQFFDDSGAVVGTHGFYVDVTSPEPVLVDQERWQEELVSERVAQIADNRAGIEQVKGMLMLVYDIEEDVAFGVLTWLSQHHNVKVRALAEQLGMDLRGVATFDRSGFDHVLLTAHERLRTRGSPTQ